MRTVFNGSITNYSDLPLRRRNIVLSINPEEDVTRAITLFRQAVENIEGVLARPQLTVQAEKVNGAGVQIAIRFWTDQSSSNIFEIHSQVVQAIRSVAVTEKISLSSAVQVVQLGVNVRGAYLILPEASHGRGRVQSNRILGRA